MSSSENGGSGVATNDTAPANNTAKPPGTTTPDTAQQEGDQQRINTYLVWILGVALLGLVFGIVFLSIKKETVTLPNGLTSLASLIAGGLLALLNPIQGIRARSQKNSSSAGG